jgi:hypothetical protein
MNTSQAKTIYVKIKVGPGHGRKKQKQVEKLMITIGNQSLCLRPGIGRQA